MTLPVAASRHIDPDSFPSVFDRLEDEPRAASDSRPADAAGPADDRPGAAGLADDRPGAASPSADVTHNPGFAELGLPQRLVRALQREGIAEPFPIQRAAIPDALAGRDVLGRGQTGSGKTLAFGLPVLARIAHQGRPAPGHPRALILVPTRELAIQVNDALNPLARTLGLFSRTAVGGVSYDKQIRDLRRGVDVLVATPGRLADLIERGECSLADIEISVLDEADQMADMGFLPDVTALLDQTPADGQRLLFSATLDNDVDALVTRFLNDPVTHEVDPPRAAVSTMEHHLLLIPPTEKLKVVSRIAARHGRTIMFVRTQLAVDRLVGQLAAVGVLAGALHGGKTQAVRTRTLAEFREGAMNVLVATDVAARGIHVDGISLVVHVDPPKDPKDYLHRAGRTARAGEAGTVATLVLPKQRASTYALLEKAGVDAARTPVRADSPQLAELTGAREPSGVPVVPEDRPRRGPAGGRAQGAARGGRPYGDRPRPHRADRRYGEAGRRDDDRRPTDDRPRRTDDRPRRTDDRRDDDRRGTERRGGDDRPRRRPARRPA